MVDVALVVFTVIVVLFVVILLKQKPIMSPARC